MTWSEVLILKPAPQSRGVCCGRVGLGVDLPERFVVATKEHAVGVGFTTPKKSSFFLRLVPSPR